MDVFSKGVVLGGLAAGSVLAALSAYVMFGAPWEERHGANTQPRRGLRNLGNTCFINAVVQALASLPDFLAWVQQSSEACRFARLCRSLSAVLHDLNVVDHEEGTVGTAELLGALTSHGWVIDFRQQDAHELFQVLLSSLDDELFKLRTGLWSTLDKELCSTKLLSRSGSLLPPPSPSPFQGLLSSHLSCVVCGHKFPSRLETFESLSLPIPRQPRPHLPVTLEKCLAAFTKAELVSDVNCDNCSMVKSGSKCPCIKSIELRRLPKGLCVHLQRVAWEPSQPPCKKEDHVVFPLTLELGACHGWPARTYSLMAVLVHLGEVNSGHYVTYRWLPGQQWLFTSDTDTRLVPQAEVLRSQAYMLLYQRRRRQDAH